MVLPILNICNGWVSRYSLLCIDFEQVIYASSATTRGTFRTRRFTGDVYLPNVIARASTHLTMRRACYSLARRKFSGFREWIIWIYGGILNHRPISSTTVALSGWKMGKGHFEGEGASGIWWDETVAAVKAREACMYGFRS
jgi:hypothetical protein